MKSLASRWAGWVATGWLLVVALPGLPAADQSPLRVGVTPQFAPVIYKEGGKLTGLEVDFAKGLGEALGRPIQFVELKWSEQIPALTEGRTDIIMSSMSITRARMAQVQFTRPYLRVGQAVLVRQEDRGLYMLGFPAVLPAAVGVMEATTGDFLVRQEWPKAKRREYAEGRQAAEALLKKKIGMFVSDAPLVWWLAGVYEAKGLSVVPRLLSDEQLAWAVRRSDEALLKAANDLLQSWEESGRSRTMIQRWLPMSQ